MKPTTSGEQCHIERAARYLPRWDQGTLPPAPALDWRPATLIGPGLMMVGCAIGGGEWLMGPAVTAQYGGIVMGLATLSIACQVAYNLGVMRYTLYCGEPIFVGFFRLWPGPLFWAIFYLFFGLFCGVAVFGGQCSRPFARCFSGPHAQRSRTAGDPNVGLWSLSCVLCAFDFRRQGLQLVGKNDGGQGCSRLGLFAISGDILRIAEDLDRGAERLCFHRHECRRELGL